MALDIILLIVIILAFFSGYKKGILFMGFFLIGITLGVIASLKLSFVTAHYLNSWLNISDAWLPLLSLLASFLIVFLLARFLANLLEKFLKSIQLNSMNKIIGGLLASGIAFSLISIGYWYLTELNFLKPDLTQNSRTYQASIEIAPVIIQQISQVIPYMKGLLQSLDEMFSQFANQQAIPNQ